MASQVERGYSAHRQLHAKKGLATIHRLTERAETIESQSIARYLGTRDENGDKTQTLTDGPGSLAP
jgi:hypothetical protein